MSKRWLGMSLGLVVACLWVSPVRAASWLVPAAVAPHLGQPAATPGWRVLSAAEKMWLPLTDRPQLYRNRIYHQLFTPNDPGYSNQWDLTAVQAPAAWDQVQAKLPGRGDSRVIVAILDTGLASAAPDYSTLHVWTNPNEIPGDGIDNDHDNLIDDVHGWDFVNTDNAPADDNGHGTHITGTIAESTDNNVAEAGLADGVTIMPLKVLDAAGSGSTDTIRAGINYAVAHGASIINLSLGGTDPDEQLHQAIQAATNQGVVVVAASGNSGTATLNYPAAYTETLSVGATQRDNTRPSYSSYGTGLDVVAPGGGGANGIVQQTCTTGDCTTFSSRSFEGTSQAAAHASGVAALLASCGETTSQIGGTLVATAFDLGPAGVDTEYGAGLIQASSALTAAGCLQTTPATPTGLIVTSGAGLTHQIQTNEMVGFRQPLFQWTGPVGQTYQVSWGKANASASVTSQISTSFNPLIESEGTYTFSVAAVNSLGQHSVAATFTYRYRRPAVVALSANTVRLYDRNWKVIRTFTIPAGAQALTAGPWSSDLSHRLLTSYPRLPSADAVLTSSGLQKNVLHPFASFQGNLSNAVVRTTTTTPQLVVATSSQGASLVWYSTAGRVLRRQQLYLTYRGGLQLASGDIDGDHQDEVIVGQVAGSEIRVYAHTGQRLSTLTPLGRGYTGGWLVAASDTNNDDHLEVIAVARGGGSKHHVFALTLHGTTLAHWVASTGSYGGSIDMVTSDVVGDGHDRIMLASRQSGNFIQQWTLQGLKERQFSITGARGLMLAALP